MHPRLGFQRADTEADGFAESAVSASTFAVPTTFLWLCDLAILATMTVIAWSSMGEIQWLAAAERLGRVPGLSVFALPPESAATGRLPLRDVAWIPLVMIPVTLLFVHLLGGYRALLEQSRTRLVGSTLLAPMFGLSAVALVIIAVRNEHTSRALLFSLSLLNAAGLLACRKSLRYYKLRRLAAGHYARNVVVIARADVQDALDAHFARHISPRLYRLFGFLDASPASAARRAQTMGAVEDLGDLLIHRPIHEVVAVHGADADRWLPKVVEHCEYFQVVLRLVPDVLVRSDTGQWSTLFGRGPLHLPEVVLRPTYLHHDALFVKRLFDIVVSAALLALLSPLFVLIAIAIKLTTPGLPVFYPWRVVGYKGRQFTGYKFTTMHADADKRVAELHHLNEMQGPVFKIRHDPRVTPLGRILRKFSLNELPQLWSVLKGDMSLVGPRPAYATELARYELWHKRKLCVQPGITCLWQVRGRNKISNFDDWVRMDFEYIDNWSLWLDVRILLRTAWAVLAGTGA